MDVNNEILLKRYKMICKNKGLTEESIKAICGCDIPVFGDRQLEEISHIDVEDFFDYCINERFNGGRGELSLFLKRL